MIMQQTFSRPGVMLEVLGEGVLLQGSTGVGKSDLALGLIDRGHTLVADDLVEFDVEQDKLLGRAPAGMEGFIEIRGLGVINLVELYGVHVMSDNVPLSLVLQLENQPVDTDDRLMPVESPWQLAHIKVPAWRLPYAHQRYLPLIVETAVRLNQARRQGYDALSDFQTKLANLMKEGAA
jgi:HPr kinase/phosphorylase